VLAKGNKRKKKNFGGGGEGIFPTILSINGTVDPSVGKTGHTISRKS